MHILELADGRRIRARAVVIATGARYRRPEIPNLAAVRGSRRFLLGLARRGAAVPKRGRGSAGWREFGGPGRGVSREPRAPRARVVRGPDLSSTMSRYLIERIAGSPNIDVIGDTEVVELLGTPDVGLQGVRWRNRRTGAEEQHAIAHLFLFTGADPAASWLTSSGVPLDEKGFIRTGADVRFDRARAATARDRCRGDFRGRRRALRLGEAGGSGHRRGGRGRRTAAHLPRPAWLYAGQREARRGTPIRNRPRLDPPHSFVASLTGRNSMPSCVYVMPQC